ncbi:hypothetical protein QJS10_CPA07g01012 [Acorus calamus]|uniref:Uncharacterized protein n=1 Tax=Acorus calamus TaxID=4465 RepID=A0AAV9EHW2_ACOCL|nr:hypothetical protein QJS10_CPA07g01012 [Acorus calamus]
MRPLHGSLLCRRDERLRASFNPIKLLASLGDEEQKQDQLETELPKFNDGSSPHMINGDEGEEDMGFVLGIADVDWLQGFCIGKIDIYSRESVFWASLSPSSVSLKGFILGIADWEPLSSEDSRVSSLPYRPNAHRY